MAFNKGNIVRFKCGYWGDEKDPETGRLGVIEYSYGERYGNGEIYGGYSVLDKENGYSSSWWEEEYLEFVSGGGIEEIEKCKEIYRKRKEQQENVEYIREKILSDGMGISTNSILKLFHEIGYVSSFERNGEYFCLENDWLKLYPIFHSLFSRKYDEMIKSLDIFKEEYREKYKEKAIIFYNKVNGQQIDNRYFTMTVQEILKGSED